MTQPPKPRTRSDRPLTMKSVMTPFPYTIGIEASVRDGLDLMADHEIRHLPVKDSDGALLGVVSERDIRLILAASAAETGNRGSAAAEDRADRIRIHDAFLAEAYSVELSTPLKVVAETMAQRRVGAVLVTKEGRLAGIFTAVDACRLLAETLPAEYGVGGTGDDAA